MKKLVITCMLLSATIITFAQSKPAKTKTSATTSAAVEPHDLNPAQIKSAQQKAEKRSKDLKTKLALTQDQYEKVYEAEMRYQKNYEMYPAGKIPSGFLSNITSERNSLIQAAVTADQYNKYVAMNTAKTK